MAKRARGQGTLYKTTDKWRNTKWVAEAWVGSLDGNRHRLRAHGTTQQEALAKLSKKTRTHNATNRPGLTVNDYMTEWLAHKKNTVRASSHAHYTADHRLYIKPALGNLRLTSVTPLRAQKVINEIQAQGKPHMADRVRRTLKQATRQAVRWGILESDPLTYVEPVKRPDVERGVWTPDQARAFLTAVNASKYALLFETAISTGVRIGEAVSLQHNDVSTDPPGIHVRRTLSRGNAIEPPKTKAGRRFIHVTTELATRLSQAPKHDSSNLLFPSTTGKHISQRNIIRVLHDYAERSGVPKIRFHDLRRTYATMLAMNGTPPKIIQANLGHSTPTLAMTVYTDVFEDHKAEAVITLQVEKGVEESEK